MESISGDKVMAVFVDEYSGLVITKPMKAKNDIAISDINAIKDVLAIASANDHKIYHMRSDSEKNSHQVKQRC